MYTIIIFGVIFFLVTLISYINDIEYFSDCFLFLFISILSGMFGVLIGIGVASVLPSDTYLKPHSVDLVCIQDNSSIKGQFFLGCGQIEGDMKYAFYYNQGDDSYKLDTISCSKAEIKYVATKPRITYNTKEFTNKWYNKFSVFTQNIYYTIEIPEGSIKKDFTLDAK